MYASELARVSGGCLSKSQLKLECCESYCELNYIRQKKSSVLGSTSSILRMLSVLIIFSACSMCTIIILCVAICLAAKTDMLGPPGGLFSSSLFLKFNAQAGFFDLLRCDYSSAGRLPWACDFLGRMSIMLNSVLVFESI